MTNRMTTSVFPAFEETRRKIENFLLIENNDLPIRCSLFAIIHRQNSTAIALGSWRNREAHETNEDQYETEESQFD